MSGSIRSTGCWEWLGGKNDKGYGRYLSLPWKAQTRAQLAHRAAWLLFHGPIPADERHKYKTYGVLHHCDNKACVAAGPSLPGDAAR